MEAFRSQGMKALYGVIISAIGVVFLIQFRPGAGQQQSSGVKDTCAAEVRGECITVRDLRTSFGLIAGRRDEAFIKQALGAAPKKIIVVPGRLVNIVV